MYSVTVPVVVTVTTVTPVVTTFDAAMVIAISNSDNSSSMSGVGGK